MVRVRDFNRIVSDTSKIRESDATPSAANYDRIPRIIAKSFFCDVWDCEDEFFIRKSKTSIPPLIKPCI